MKPIYELLVEDIKTIGIEVVFGLISDDICQLIATLEASGVRYIGARHENSAVMMAAGYAKTTGKLGVAIIGRGPALANGMHGLVTASRVNAPILVITGEAPVNSLTPDAIGPDIKAYAGESVLKVAGFSTYSPKSAHTVRQSLHDAIGEAMQDKIAVLMLPSDIQIAEIDADSRAPPASATRRVANPIKARRQAIESAAAVIANRTRPVILVGIGAHRAGAKESIAKLAAKTGALIVSTLKAKDMFHGHPDNLGILGSSSHSVARRYVEQADCVIVIGASLNRFTMSAGISVPAVPLIHVDATRANIGRYWYADVAVVGDANLVVEQLIEALPERSATDKPFHSNSIREEIAAFDHHQDFRPENTARTIDPRVAALELDKVLPPTRQLIFDAGNFMFVWAYLSVPSPTHLVCANEFGSIGVGMGLAIGAAVGRPDHTSVGFIGDGGLLMTLGELETVAREAIPLAIVVMNDSSYGAEVHFLRAYGHAISTARFLDVDFAPIAESLGFETATVRTPDDIRKLEPLLRNLEGPILIDCKINGEVMAPFMSEFLGPK